MARPPSILSQARKLREAIGLNQSEMAELLGISRQTIEKLENRKLKLSRPMAYKYLRVTGCDLRQGDTEKGEGELEVEATTEGGRPYTEGIFVSHQESIKLLMEEQASDRISSLTAVLIQLLEAARKKGTLLGVSEDVERFLAETFHLHGLESAVSEHLEEERGMSRSEAQNLARRVGVLPFQAGLEISTLDQRKS